MDNFELWWTDHGCRTLAHNAQDWALAGWLGHKIHCGKAPIEEEPKQIEET